MNDSYRICEATDAELDTVYGLMQQQFEPGEVKPLERIRELRGKGRYSALLLKRGSELLAYALIMGRPEEGSVLLDYLAVLPEHQDSGIGSLFLRRLCADRSLLIEAEDPDFGVSDSDIAHRERRLRFYRRAGCVDTGIRALVFGFDYVVLALERPTLSGAEADFIRLYREMVPEPLYTQNVRIKGSGHA